MHFPLWTSHQRSMPSLPPLSSSSPLGAQTTAETTPGCPAKTLLPALPLPRRGCQAGWRSPLCASHTNSSPPSLPLPPEASRVPSGLQATHVTTPGCPASRRSCVPSAASHTYTWPSSSPPTRRVPSGLQATRRTRVACARPTQRGERAVTSHTSTPCRKVPLARRSPSELHATP